MSSFYLNKIEQICSNVKFSQKADIKKTPYIHAFIHLSSQIRDSGVFKVIHTNYF